MTGEPAVVFLGGEICAACSAEMAAELESASGGPSTEPSGISGAHDLADRRRAAASPGGALVSAAEGALADVESAPSFTPGSETVTCAGCERPMPGPGSYRVLRGKPYCAACLPFFARLPPAAYEATPEPDGRSLPGGLPSSGAPSGGGVSRASTSSVPVSSVPASSSPLARPGQCDCCRRALDDLAQRREGFELCSACLTSDAELALSVARARHRRALARLRNQLEGSS